MKTTLRLTIAAFGLAIFAVSTTTVRGQFNYETNNGTITITGYTGPGGSVSIPNTISGLPVTSIGDWAFYYCTSLTNITIGNSVISIGESAFQLCTRLTIVTIPNSVTSIGNSAFAECSSLACISLPDSITWIGNNLFEACSNLTSVTIPASVSRIGNYAFKACVGLTNIIIPASVTSIGECAFENCTGLAGVYFQGNAPNIYGLPLSGATSVKVYYLPGTTDWEATLGGCPTALWVLPRPVILTSAPNFGVQADGFGFRISWATNASVVVEASTDLANPVWRPVFTNTLTDGWSYFSDSQWANDCVRFYRVGLAGFVNPPVNQPPTVSITQPTEGGIFLVPTNITITATASDTDGTVQKVEFHWFGGGLAGGLSRLVRIRVRPTPSCGSIRNPGRLS